MKLALISCMIFSREVNHLIANSDNIVHSFWLEKSLHDYPDKLRVSIQNTIKLIEAMNKRNIDNKPFDAIVLGYGLCSKGTINLSSKSLPIIIPKCFDCMALFLGSNQKYVVLTQKYKNISWYNKAWIENSYVPSTETEGEPDVESDKCAVFLKSKIFDDTQQQNFIEKTAKYFKWEYIKVDSDMNYFKNLLQGNWDDRLFLTCHVGYRTAYNNKKNEIYARRLEE